MPWACFHWYRGRSLKKSCACRQNRRLVKIFRFLLMAAHRVGYFIGHQQQILMQTIYAFDGMVIEHRAITLFFTSPIKILPVIMHGFFQSCQCPRRLCVSNARYFYEAGAFKWLSYICSFAVGRYIEINITSSNENRVAGFHWRAEAKMISPKVILTCIL